MTGQPLTREEESQIREHLDYTKEEFGTAIADYEVDSQARQVTIRFDAAYPDSRSYTAKITSDSDIPDYLERHEGPESKEDGYTITYRVPEGESFVPR